jgi:N-formylglutamate deformylase
MDMIKNVTTTVPSTILHIPHSSRIIPPTARASILLSDEALAREMRLMTDSFTDELFQVDPSLATSVVFPVSRLVVDPERFQDDSLESMAKRGMGAVYTRTSDGDILRMEGNTSERERLIAEYYGPHHHHLTDVVQAALDRWKSCLIIDCHSFTSVPLPHELDQSPDRPEICIGTDEFHSPKSLEMRAIELFEKAGFRTFLNQPFAGALVPMAFYHRDLRVRAIMVEVNRRLYMDEASGQRVPSFAAFRMRLHEVLTKLLETAC